MAKNNEIDSKPYRTCCALGGKLKLPRGPETEFRNMIIRCYKWNQVISPHCHLAPSRIGHLAPLISHLAP